MCANVNSFAYKRVFVTLDYVNSIRMCSIHGDDNDVEMVVKYSFGFSYNMFVRNPDLAF